MQIKVADVAELVDATDLKFVAPFEIHRIYKTKIDAKRRGLHNAWIAALAAVALITTPNALERVKRSGSKFSIDFYK